ncbi:unnamed protein product [Notodromas monacha]|uniref:Mitochondrial ribosomal protein L32 n=1 Tax=Notodromas monacha TaxID=399045 RepID=A0A7R9BV81_9CRUS|nr:unnamed protein product [Notodromas monacha]CAG0920847.1 unnamed protein product [Notodromas monacha]
MDLIVRSHLLCRVLARRASAMMENWVQWGGFNPTPSVCVQILGGGSAEISPGKDDGFLWAVPTKRRCVERRTIRRFGAENWTNGRKLLQVKRTLLVCKDCGHDYEAGKLCRNCLDTVMEETKAMQAAMEKTWGKSAIDQDVEFVYQNEQAERVTNTGKRLIEMDRPRPSWFNKNLVERSAKPERSESKTLRPSHELIG